MLQEQMVAGDRLPDVEFLCSAALPTRAGGFRAMVFHVAGDITDHLALVHGDLEVPSAVAPLVRLHSECFTGDSLGSLRCDCGEQLQLALTRIAQSECGVLLYLHQEGRGIGLTNKIRAYALQDAGLDTVDANTALGLPIDAREYTSAAAILHHLGLTRIRLLTNNPAKRLALENSGIEVVERVPVETVPHAVNLPYLRTKALRLGHELLNIDASFSTTHEPLVRAPGEPHPTRPFVTIHYAQTLDGRIATHTGHSQWISGDESLTLAHQLRVAHEGIMVGVGTVVADNPRLTARLAAGHSPTRIVMDSKLRLPADANVLTDHAAATVIMTTAKAPARRRRELERMGVQVIAAGMLPNGQVDLEDALRRLREQGIRSLLVEGGAALITSLLRAGLVDRLIVCIAPKVLGAGIEAVGELGCVRLDEAVVFTRSTAVSLGRDIVFEGDL